MSEPVDERTYTERETAMIFGAISTIESLLGASVAGVIMVDPDSRVFIVPAPGLEKRLPEFLASINWASQRRIWQEHLA